MAPFVLSSTLLFCRRRAVWLFLLCCRRLLNFCQFQQRIPAGHDLFNEYLSLFIKFLLVLVCRSSCPCWSFFLLLGIVNDNCSPDTGSTPSCSAFIAAAILLFHRTRSARF